jgi:hypothetical protein
VTVTRCVGCVRKSSIFCHVLWLARQKSKTWDVGRGEGEGLGNGYDGGGGGGVEGGWSRAGDEFMNRL